MIKNIYEELIEYMLAYQFALKALWVSHGYHSRKFDAIGWQ